MAKYNGHKNWNHWNVSLWLNNDEGLYQQARYYVFDSDDKDTAARRMLDCLPAKTPDGAPYSVTTIRAAMRGM
jgi:hypothetical protein